MDTFNLNHRVPARNCARLTRPRRLTEEYRKANERCAKIVIDNLDRYGRGSLLKQWASATLNRQEAATTQPYYVLDQHGSLLLPNEIEQSSDLARAQWRALLLARDASTWRRDE